MLRRLVTTLASASVLLVSAGLSHAQTVISAKSGLVHYVEGSVLLDGKPVSVEYSQFPEVREGQVLNTEEGRAEVLLNPGAFLRLAESSSFRMISRKLTDTRIEPLAGAMILEVGEAEKDTSLSLMYKDQTITFSKAGLFRIDASSGAFRVYQGEAKITRSGQTLVAKQSREVILAAPVLTAMKFDTKEDDEFYRWASRRASYLALANVSAAKSMRDSGWVATGSPYSYGMWRYNSFFGMFTYIPYNAMYNSPFGYSFFSPYLVGAYYNNYPGYYYSNPGYYGGGGGGSAAAAMATRGSVNYAAPSRPSMVSGSSEGGFSRGQAQGGFGARHDTGSFGDFGRGSYSGGGGGYSGGSVSSVSSGGGGAVSSGGGASAAPSGGGGGGGAAGGHGR